MVEKSISIKQYSLLTYHYDQEWIDLIIEAKRSGLSPTEVRDFLIKSTPIVQSIDLKSH